MCNLVFQSWKSSGWRLVNICWLYFHCEPITKADVLLGPVIATSITTCTTTSPCSPPEVGDCVGGLTFNCCVCSTAPEVPASLRRGMSPGEIRQRSSSASRLRHGIDAESSRGGLMMFQSYPHTLLLFFCLSTFARCTWPVQSCCRLTTTPLSSRSCGVGGLPTLGSCSQDDNCRWKLWTKATFM